MNNTSRHDTIKKFCDKIANEERLPPITEKYEELMCFSDFLISNKNVIPPLYRYSAADYWNIRSLEQEKLVLSSADTMNDVFEGDIVNYLSIDNNGESSDVVKSTYLKSLSTKENDILMFAHYGDEFKGMCVKYDLSKAKDENLRELFPIAYAKKPFLSIRPNQLKATPYLFLKKSEVWKYENEWRFIRICSDTFNKQQEVTLKDCIKAVYLGMRMEKAKQEHIKEICKKKKFDCYKVKLNEEKYELEVIKCQP